MTLAELKHVIDVVYRFASRNIRENEELAAAVLNAQEQLEPECSDYTPPKKTEPQ